jgi:hypothetical protein
MAPEAFFALSLLVVAISARPTIETVNNSIVIISPSLELRDPANVLAPIDLRVLATLASTMQQTISTLQAEVASLRQAVSTDCGFVFQNCELIPAFGRECNNSSSIRSECRLPHTDGRIGHLPPIK